MLFVNYTSVINKKTLNNNKEPNHKPQFIKEQYKAGDMKMEVTTKCAKTLELFPKLFLKF